MRPSELPTKVDDNLVAFDTETSGLHPDDGARVSTVSVAYRADGELFAWAFPFDQGQLADKDGAKPSLFDMDDADRNLPQEEWQALMDWLEWRDLMAHDIKFDTRMAKAGTRHWPGLDLTPFIWWDTEICQWLLDPLESRGLKETAFRLWGIVDDERKALKPFLRNNTLGEVRYDLVPIDIMNPYAANDARLCYMVGETQAERLEGTDAGLGRQWDREREICRTLCRMEQRGIGYDVEASMAEAAKAEALRNRIEGRLPFRATPDQARKWFERQGAIPHCVTEKGAKLSVGECCVRTFIAQGIPGAEDWAAYTKVDHAISKYYRGFAERTGTDGRLRTSFQQMGTVSMRFSSQRVNLQALPHDYRLELVEGVAPPRTLFVPAPGKVLYEMDLAQAELRRGAKVAGCKRMLELIEAGEDLHNDTCRNLFHIDEDHPDWFPRRQTTKRCNFGLIYMIGPDTFQRDLEKQTGIKISRSESQDIVSRWRELYPEFPAINKKAERLARRRGYIALVGGRLRWFRQYEELHKAFNTKIQGDIAELMKMAMLEIEGMWPDTLLLQIHDSLVVELDADGAAEQAREMADVLAKVATDVFNIGMTSDVKPWHKEAA